MSDHRRGGGADEPEQADGLEAIVDAAVRKIATAIVIAGGVIGLAIYAHGGDAPRYQVTAADGRILRVNTSSGTVIACENGHCAIVLRHGQRLERHLPTLPPAPPQQQLKAQPQQQLPAPAPAPADR